MPGFRTPQRELSARTQHAGGYQGGSSHAGALSCRRRLRPRRSGRVRRRRWLWCCLGLRSAAARGRVRGPALAGRPLTRTRTLTPTLIQTLALAQARTVTRSGSGARSSHQETGHQERGQHERGPHPLHPQSEGVVEGELGRLVQEQLARLRSSCGQQRQRQQSPPPPPQPPQQQPQQQQEEQEEQEQMPAKQRDLSATTSPVSSRSDSASPVTLPGGSGSDRSVSDSSASDRSCSDRS